MNKKKAQKEYTGTIITIGGVNLYEKRIVPYSPKVETVQTGDGICIDGTEYVRTGCGHEWREEKLYYVLGLFTRELWEMNERSRREREKWQFVLRIREVFEGKSPREMFPVESPVHRVYALEDLCYSKVHK